MSDFDPTSSNAGYRPGLMQEALALARDPRAAQLIAARLLAYAQWQHIAEVVREVDNFLTVADRVEMAHVTRLAELEAERARFLDPNRPGE